MNEQPNNVVVIKSFFEADGGRKVSMEELKQLSPEARQELADLVRHESAVPAEIAA